MYMFVRNSKKIFTLTDIPHISYTKRVVYIYMRGEINKGVSTLLLSADRAHRSPCHAIASTFN